MNKTFTKNKSDYNLQRQQHHPNNQPNNKGLAQSVGGAIKGQNINDNNNNAQPYFNNQI